MPITVATSEPMPRAAVCPMRHWSETAITTASAPANTHKKMRLSVSLNIF